jgi:hypothetical protein
MFGQSSAYLRDLIGVLLAGMEDIELTSSHDLRYTRQTMERGRV